MKSETENYVWQFETAQFRVVLELDLDPTFGDEEESKIRYGLASGELVAFNSDVIVYFRGEEIGRDSLSGSVYRWNSVSDFW